jgi:hypothetical protein
LAKKSLASVLFCAESFLFASRHRFERSAEALFPVVLGHCLCD